MPCSIRWTERLKPSMGIALSLAAGLTVSRCERDASSPALYVAGADDCASWSSHAA